MQDEVAALDRRRASAASANRTPSADATSALVGSTSTSVTAAPGMPASRRATQHPTIPRTDHGHPVTDEGRRVPERVDGRLDRAGEHGPLGGTPSGTTDTASTGTTNALWCG